MSVLMEAVEIWEKKQAGAMDEAWAMLALSQHLEPGLDPELSQMLEKTLRQEMGGPTSLMACKECREFFYHPEIGEFLTFSNWATWLRLYRNSGQCEWCKEKKE